MMQFSFQDAIRSVQLVRPVPGAFSCPSVDCRVAQRRSELWIDHLVRMSQPFSQTVTHQLQRVSLTVSSGTPPLVYRSAEALATDGGLVVAKDLPDSAGGVKTFGQQEGSKEEEEASDPVNGILEIVDPAGGQRVRWRRTLLLFRHTSAPEHAAGQAGDSGGGGIKEGREPPAPFGHPCLDLAGWELGKMEGRDCTYRSHSNGKGVRGASDANTCSAQGGHLPLPKVDPLSPHGGSQIPPMPEKQVPEVSSLFRVATCSGKAGLCSHTGHFERGSGTRFVEHNFGELIPN